MKDDLNTQILLWIHQFSNPVADQFMLMITRLGNAEIVVPIFTITLMLLLFKRRNTEAGCFAIACLGSVILNNGLKLVFKQPRPHLWPQPIIIEITYSFPSGHALGSMVLYGMIAYLSARFFPQFCRPIYILAAILIGLIGFSRLYLGVHWPTDIIGGYSIGLLWLFICIRGLQL
jgi:membrane-associated phospholipid phosphatase